MVNQKNFEKAMHAALEGPEVKKIKIEKHEYNVKPIKVTKNGSQLSAKGQISHHLRFRDDDQVHYSFTVTPGQVLSLKDIDVNIDYSFMNSALTALWDKVLKELLAKMLEQKMEDVGQESAMLLTNAQESAERVYEESKKLLDGSWEAEASFMIVNIAARVSLGAAVAAKTKVDPLVFARRLSKPAQRLPTRTGGPVRDHRTRQH
jgi:hypothetical protein